MTLSPALTRAQLDTLAESLIPLSRAGDDAEAFDDALLDFLKVVHYSGFIVPFDWQADIASRTKEVESAAALQSMDADTFRRTVIAHVRMDRFVEGHLRKLARTGYLAAVVERARQLSATL